MTNIEKLLEEILDIEYKLNSYIPSTLWISDLHGEGDKFTRIIKERFGMLYQTCKEVLPQSFSSQKISYIASTIRKTKFIYSSNLKMDCQDIIQCLVVILKYKIENLRVDPFKEKSVFIEAMQRLTSGHKIPNIWYEEWFSKKLIYHLSKTILEVFLNHLVVLGDVFDRGPCPDKIVRILQNKRVKNNMSLVLGNHDVLWLGACAGNLSLIAEALRITCRYDHLAFLNRMQINYEKLQAFAVQTYPNNKITGNYKAKNAETRSMEKALSIIQFKLEEQTIKKHPEYEMQSRLWLDKLAAKLKNQDTADLLDKHFPTLNLDNPQELSPEEKVIIEDLKEQFFNKPKLKNCISIFFEIGSTYHIYNNILSLHALLPTDKAGNFEKFLGYKGKELLDYYQKLIEQVGENYLNSIESSDSDLSLLFYLWCGPKSPLFGKDAMKTFERYFLKDKEQWKENTLFWEENLQKPEFQQKIKDTFLVSKIVYGHTPVDYNKGQKLTSSNNFAINIDGGFAKAYLNRGHALVQTPKMLYGIILHSDKEFQADKPPEKIDIIEEYTNPLKIKDTKMAVVLDRKKLQLKKQINKELNS